MYTKTQLALQAEHLFEAMSLPVIYEIDVLFIADANNKPIMTENSRIYINVFKSGRGFVAMYVLFTYLESTKSISTQLFENITLYRYIT